MAKGVFVDRVMAMCVNATVEDLVLDWPSVVGTHHWHQIAGIDRTSATTRTEVGVKRGSEFYPYMTAVAPAAGATVAVAGGIVSPGDYVPCIRFVGATAGDVLELMVNGEYEPE